MMAFRLKDKGSRPKTSNGHSVRIFVPQAISFPSVSSCPGTGFFG